MASISGMYTALSGLNAQRRVLDVTAHNIANEGTPGYHRQRAELRPGGVATVASVFAGDSMNFGGVEVQAVTRMSDELAEARLVRETGASAGAKQTSGDLSRLEAVFPEPSDDGLGATLDAFWAGFADLASNPTDLAVRSQVLQRASSTVDSIRSAAREFDGMETTARTAVIDLATEVNALAAEVAEMNSVISASPNQANDLVDKRGEVVKKLAALVGVVSRPSSAGQIDLSVGGRSLVSATNVQKMDGTGGNLQWLADGTAVDAPDSKASALHKTINETVPKYRTALDGVTAELVGAVNTLHAVGYDQDGNTGNNFFDPAGTTGSTIAISTDVAGQPRKIAAGKPVGTPPATTAPGVNDGDQARELSALGAKTTGASASYRSMITELGVEVRSAKRRSTVQDGVTRAVQAQAESVSGVSLDEEMATLMNAQRAYEASARVLTAVDQMLGFLIERVAV